MADKRNLALTCFNMEDKMPTLTKRNADDVINAIDFFMVVEKNGNLTKEDIPNLYGDGSRWKTLTLKGFLNVYEVYIESEKVL